jgi:hypothetical protein
MELCVLEAGGSDRGCDLSLCIYSKNQQKKLLIQTKQIGIWQ